MEADEHAEVVSGGGDRLAMRMEAMKSDEVVEDLGEGAGQIKHI